MRRAFSGFDRRVALGGNIINLGIYPSFVNSSAGPGSGLIWRIVNRKAWVSSLQGAIQRQVIRQNQANTSAQNAGNLIPV